MSVPSNSLYSRRSWRSERPSRLAINRLRNAFTTISTVAIFSNVLLFTVFLLPTFTVYCRNIRFWNGMHNKCWQLLQRWAWYRWECTCNVWTIEMLNVKMWVWFYSQCRDSHKHNDSSPPKCESSEMVRSIGQSQSNLLRHASIVDLNFDWNFEFLLRFFTWIFVMKEKVSFWTISEFPDIYCCYEEIDARIWTMISICWMSSMFFSFSNGKKDNFWCSKTWFLGFFQHVQGEIHDGYAHLRYLRLPSYPQWFDYVHNLMTLKPKPFN